MSEKPECGPDCCTYYKTCPDYMSRRESITKTLKVDADPGDSPNRTIGQITVEVRMFFPPNTEAELLDDLLCSITDQVASDIYTHPYVR